MFTNVIQQFRTLDSFSLYVHTKEKEFTKSAKTIHITMNKTSTPSLS